MQRAAGGAGRAPARNFRGRRPGIGPGTRGPLGLRDALCACAAPDRPKLLPAFSFIFSPSGCGDLKWEAQCCDRCHVAAVAAVACGRGSLCGPAVTTVRTICTAQRASQLLSCRHHVTLHHHLACAARAQKHDEQRRFCSPESWVSHQCQLTQWCAQFTTCGLGCEGACRV